MYRCCWCSETMMMPPIRGAKKTTTTMGCCCCCWSSSSFITSFTQHASSNWKKRAFGVEIFYALRGTRQDRLWKKKKTNTKKRSAAPSISGQKTTTESSYLGVLPGDLFVELGLRAVPERGADRCAHCLISKNLCGLFVVFLWGRKRLLIFIRWQKNH